MQTSPQSRERATRPYVVGYLLALALTAIPFYLVAARALPPVPTLAVIAAAAVVQILVHLRFFLHLGLQPALHAKLLVLAFAAVLIFILAGGTLWILFDLQVRMAGG